MVSAENLKRGIVIYSVLILTETSRSLCAQTKITTKKLPADSMEIALKKLSKATSTSENYKLTPEIAKNTTTVVRSNSLYYFLLEHGYGSRKFDTVTTKLIPE